jgi:hypothetical protein
MLTGKGNGVMHSVAPSEFAGIMARDFHWGGTVASTGGTSSR